MATVLPLIIDNSEPYFILTEEKNILKFYSQEDNLYNTNGVRIIIRDPETNKQIYSGIHNFTEDSSIISSSLPVEYTSYRVELNILAILGVAIETLLNKRLLITISLNTADLSIDTLSISKGVVKELIQETSSKTILMPYQGEENLDISPAIVLELINNDIVLVDSSFIFNPQNNHNIVFLYSYNSGNPNEKDSLLWGEYSLIDKNGIILEQSERKYFTNEVKHWWNEISLDLIQLVLQNKGTQITLKLTIRSTKGYQETFSYGLKFDDNLENYIDNTIIFDSALIATPMTEKGVIHLATSIRRQQSEENNTSVLESVTGFIQIYRKEADIVNATWKMVQKRQLFLSWDQTASLRLEFDDILAEPGQAYLYQIYFSYSTYSGILGTWLTYFANSYVATDKAVTLITDDIFLISRKAILRIKYNPSLTNYKRNIIDQVINTLGGAYPFIARNGRQKYRTFNLGGLLSYQSEVNNSYHQSEIQDSYNNHPSIAKPSIIDSFYDSLFLNIDNFNIDLSKYNSLSTQKQQDLYEKIFRDKVLDFLYSDDVILFKSLQEGNIIIRLINVSFTPEAQLGRNIYSFTSSATEVMEATPENCFNYFITDSNNYYILKDLYAKTTLTGATFKAALAEGRLETTPDSVEGSTLVLYQNEELIK